VQELRNQGYSWVEVEEEFEKEFGERKSHDTLRISTKKLLLSAYDEDEGEEEIQVPIKLRTTFKQHRGKRDPEPLPEYLLYEPKKKIKPGKAKTKGTALIIPDTHIPYHDQRAYELMLKVAKDTKNLKEIVILGDYADFYAASAHGKHPKFTHVLMDEVSQVRKELERLAKMFPNVKRVFIQGNHEYRLERYIYNNAPDLFGIIDTRSILKLDELGYEFVPYGANQKYSVMGSKLYARHEPIGGGVHAASSTVDKAGCSMIFGHIHRIQQYRKVFIDGADHMAACPGWLGDKNHPVMGYLKNHAQWQSGFAFAHIVENGHFHVDIKHIIDYTTYHNGKLYRG
jgi:predicted phosphodiesterase